MRRSLRVVVEKTVRFLCWVLRPEHLEPDGVPHAQRGEADSTKAQAPARSVSQNILRFFLSPEPLGTDERVPPQPGQGLLSFFLSPEPLATDEALPPEPRLGFLRLFLLPEQLPTEEPRASVRSRRSLNTFLRWESLPRDEVTAASSSSPSLLRWLLAWEPIPHADAPDQRNESGPRHETHPFHET